MTAGLGNGRHDASEPVHRVRGTAVAGVELRLFHERGDVRRLLLQHARERPEPGADVPAPIRVQLDATVTHRAARRAGSFARLAGVREHVREPSRAIRRTEDLGEERSRSLPVTWTALERLLEIRRRRRRDRAGARDAPARFERGAPRTARDRESTRRACAAASASTAEDVSSRWAEERGEPARRRQILRIARERRPILSRAPTDRPRARAPPRGASGAGGRDGGVFGERAELRVDLRQERPVLVGDRDALEGRKSRRIGRRDAHDGQVFLGDLARRLRRHAQLFEPGELAEHRDARKAVLHDARLPHQRVPELLGLAELGVECLDATSARRDDSGRARALPRRPRRRVAAPPNGPGKSRLRAAARRSRGPHPSRSRLHARALRRGPDSLSRVRGGAPVRRGPGENRALRRETGRTQRRAPCAIFDAVLVHFADSKRGARARRRVVVGTQLELEEPHHLLPLSAIGLEPHERADGGQVPRVGLDGARDSAGSRRRRARSRSSASSPIL